VVLIKQYVVLDWSAKHLNRVEPSPLSRERDESTSTTAHQPGARAGGSFYTNPTQPLTQRASWRPTAPAAPHPRLCERWRGRGGSNHHLRLTPPRLGARKKRAEDPSAPQPSAPTHSTTISTPSPPLKCSHQRPDDHLHQ
jgi:hypothetical protein